MDINGISTNDSELTNNKSETNENETENVNDIKGNDNINNDGTKNEEIKNKTKQYIPTLINQEITNKEKSYNEYEKILKDNPKELFKIITEETIEKWKKILYKKLPIVIHEDCNILNSENTEENCKIVSNDIPRTRTI